MYTLKIMKKGIKILYTIDNNQIYEYIKYPIIHKIELIENFAVCISTDDKRLFLLYNDDNTVLTNCISSIIQKYDLWMNDDAGLF
jgi:hypothetical protein